MKPAIVDLRERVEELERKARENQAKFEFVNEVLKEHRKRFAELLEHNKHLQDLLREGKGK